MSTYAINGLSATPEAFTQVACDPKRNVVVEACAGSGKTYLLVERMLRILADGAQPQAILAITFTKKAAGEMRERLMARLNEPQNHALYRRVLASGRSVDIRTFHSWFSSLLRVCPQAVLDELGLPSEFELVEDNADLLAEAWPAFFAFVLTSPDHLDAFNASVADMGRATTLKLLGEVLLRRSEFWAADAARVIEASQPDWRVTHAEFADEAGGDVAHALWTRLPYVELFDAALRHLLSSSGKTPNKQGSLAADAIAARNFDGLAAAMLTKEGQPRKLGEDCDVKAAQDLIVAARDAMDAQRQCEHHRRTHVLAGALVRCFREVQIKLKKVDLQEVELAAKRLLTDPLLGGWIAEKLDARLSQVLIDEFQDTNPLQWQALSQWLSSYAGAGSDMGVFIVGDPKQSIYGFRGAQAGVFEAAKAFMSEQMSAQLLSTDNTRRCSAEVVKAINDVLMPLALLPASDALSYSQFRAHSAQRGPLGGRAHVICLPRINRPPKQARSGVGPMDPHAEWEELRSAFESRPGQGELSPAQQVREAELAQVANWIAQQVSAGVPGGDIMVLGRTRASVAGLGPLLRERGLAFVQHVDRALADTVEVQDVLALLDALASPSHNLSLAQALKSPIFGWGDEALTDLALVAREARVQSWLKILLNDEHQAQWIRRPGADLTQKTGFLLRQYAKWAAQLPPHDALSRIYADAGVDLAGADLPTRFASAAPSIVRDSVQSNLYTLLGATLDVNAGRFVSLYALVRSLKRTGLKAAAINAPGAVVGMTIHAAKGLQARVVVLVDADPHERAESTGGMKLDWQADSDAPSRLVFVRPGHSPAFLADLQARQAAQAQTEQINAWYVAMTRAVDTLVVSAGEPFVAGPLRPWVRMAQVVATMPVAAQVPGGAPMAAQATFDTKILPNLPLVAESIDVDAIKIDDLDALKASRVKSEQQRLGQAVHTLLQWYSPQTQAWPPDAQRAAATQHGLGAAVSERAMRMAQTMVSGQAAWVWDLSQLRSCVNELDLHHRGEPLRADRVVQHQDGTWWVFDFKTSLSQLAESAAQTMAIAKAIAQVAAYKRAFAQSLLAMGWADAVVKAALIRADGSIHVIDGLEIG